MRSHGPTKASALLSMLLTSCQQLGPAQPVTTVQDIDYSGFKACVDRELKAAVERHGSEWGYPIGTENDIIAICNPKLRKETVNDSAYTTNQYFLYVNSSVEAELTRLRHAKVDEEIKEQRRKDELNAPRLKAEKAEEDNAFGHYVRCLIDHAKILALNSSESAEVVAHAAFPSCLREREAVFDVYRRHGHDFSREAMEIAERRFYEDLLLEIIQARAPASPSPTPPPPPKSSGRDI